MFQLNEQRKWVLAPTVLSFFFKLLTSRRIPPDLYLITQVSSDQEEAQFSELIQESALAQYGLDPRVRPHDLSIAALGGNFYSLVVQKVLFCSSSEGRRHMVRQLSPGLHIDGTYDLLLFWRL